jgi:pimeloyl-ACP methyl ester carboxylesterase
VKALAKACALFALTMLLGCHRTEKKASASELSLPPLSSPAATATLSVPGAGDAVVAIPVGITRPAPVVVAVLGNGDTPESQCAVWRELVGARAFVLCPRGVPYWLPDEPDAGADAEADARAPVSPPALRQVGFYPSDVDALAREVGAGLASLRGRWGDYVAAEGVVYAGFSRGAFLGASLVAREPGRFKRAILIEGGQTPWNDETASRFAAGGGERVLFVCGQPSCVDEAKPAAALLGSRKVDTRVVQGQGEGHGYKHQVKDELQRSLGWITEGDPLWR